MEDRVTGKASVDAKKKDGSAGRFGITLLVCALALAGCTASEIGTQTVVCLRIEAASRARADALRIEVFDQDGVRVLSREDPLPAAGEPARIPLRPAGGDAARTYRVHAALLSGGAAFASTVARGGYIDGELGVQPLRFFDACLDVLCPEGARCVADAAGPRCDTSTSRIGVADEKTLSSACPAQDSGCDACGECEECVDGACTPKAAGSTCGECDSDVCSEGLCLPGSEVSTFDVGARHACASITVDGDADLYCWGRNSEAQLGLGEPSEPITSPQRTQIIEALTQISLGARHGCGIDEGGQVVCWGSNDAGQLGSSGEGPSPRAVELASAPTDIASGEAFSCVLLADGLACWGAGNEGQLANECGGGSPSPVTQAFVGVEEIVAGDRHACVSVRVATDGQQLHCWGDNDQSQSARDGQMQVCEPTSVGGIGDIVAAAAGAEYWCFAGANGTVRCGGRNDFGQLGVPPSDPVRDTETIPFTQGQPEDERVDFIRAGNAHTFLQIGLNVFSFGDNRRGQLGRVGEGPDPAAVLGEWAEVHARGDQACATTVDGRLYCWGANESGQLGNGSFEDRSAPARVCFPR